MGSYIDEGFYKDSDPIYQEGFSIMAPKKSKKQSKSSLTSSELNTLKERGLRLLQEQHEEFIKDSLK